MATELPRLSCMTALLPIFVIGALPVWVFAQVPGVATIPETENARVSLEEPSWPAAPELEGPWRGSLAQFFTDAEWYFSWGASREQWAPTNIRVSQPSQGNFFTAYHVHAVDDPAWTSLFGGQYNWRLGRFLDDANTWAVEVNFDHSKFTSVRGQTTQIAGTLAGRPVNANYQLDRPFFTYDLHNGANHLLVNLVKRVPLIGETNEPWSVAAIGKAGVGMMLPHPENVIMGRPVDVGRKTFDNVVGVGQGWWQIDGWTTAVEVGFRVNLMRNVYLELTDKVAYAQLRDVTVYQGSASHDLWMNEVVLSLGITLGGGR